MPIDVGVRVFSLTASLVAFIIRLTKDKRCPVGEDGTSSAGLK